MNKLLRMLLNKIVVTVVFKDDTTQISKMGDIFYDEIKAKAIEWVNPKKVTIRLRK